jgi:L-fuconolactonase
MAGAALGAPALAHPAAAREPARGTVIDAHTHFYDPTRPGGVPWPPKSDRLLYRPVLPEHYRRVTEGRGVRGTVVVEASPRLEDNQWVLDLAAHNPVIVGFVGRLAPGADGYRGHLRRFAGNPLFRGLRLGAPELAEGLGRDRFVGDLKLLAEHDLALDVVGGPGMLPDVARLARLVPGLRVVIDHAAGVAIDGKAVPAAWRDGLRAAAGHPRVYCKVSGLVEATGREGADVPTAVRYYRPVLDALWEAFGEDRLVYGSNWPVSERFAPYAAVQELVAVYARSRGEAVTEKVFWRNASAAYKWVRR